jgi:hypothetical protein
MKQLYARWGDAVHFVDVVIRQAHPGPGAPPYQRFTQKLADAQRYQREEGIPWLVLVDDLEGTVHQAYGGLADPTYLIDREGRVAFYNLWTHGPALHAAIEALLAQEGRGVVRGGIYRTPQLLPAVTEGWRGIERGLPQSYVDLELAAPGAGAATWLGRWFRPLLRPLTRRAHPLSPAARIGLTAGALALGALGLRRLRRRS